MRKFLKTYFKAYSFAVLLFLIILLSEVQFLSRDFIYLIKHFFSFIVPTSILYAVPVAFLMWYCGQFDFQKPGFTKIVKIFLFIIIGMVVTIVEKLLEFYLGTWDFDLSFTTFLRKRFFSSWLGLSIYSMIYGAISVSIRNMRNNVLLHEQLQNVSINAIKKQLEHHFLFNNLNTLYSLIDDKNKKALDFLHNMSELYRYLLKNANNQTVSLIEELTIVEKFIKMAEERFGANLLVSINYSHELTAEARVPPLSIYNLLENVIKHNVIDDNHQIVCRIDVSSHFVVVSNNMIKKRNSLINENNGIGLDSLRKIYMMLSGKGIQININDDFFTVKVPILKSEQINSKNKFLAYEGSSY
ncbi:histidine kinase [Olivibacter sp. 47]|uniref:sensor histidine kinase n=1 Tax=Olivibacter sp. 47 TaxID=3056486 RepID=UPI0025A44991|nr:histidine kinase [Olivibacter sp. 47]MDM8173652.1 histidine kinase [Olivibacter sp. 47]